MHKNKKKTLYVESPIERKIYYILYILVCFFISVGIVTKNVIVLPYILFRQIANFLKSISLKKAAAKVTSQKQAVFKNISSIHLPSFKISLSFFVKSKKVSKKKIKKITSEKKKVYSSIYTVWIKWIKDIRLFLFAFSKAVFRILLRGLSILKKVVIIAGKAGIAFLLRILSILFWFIKLPYHLFQSFLTVKFRFFILGFIVCFVVVLTYQGYIFIKGLPSPKDIGKTNFPVSTQITDRKGRLLYEVYKDQNRTPIKLSELPSYVYQASIAIEDKDFYKHNGVSLLSGILRAAKETFLKKNLQGGSTITQQLVKSSLLSPERTIERKLKEIILAMETERQYSKTQILEMYLNQVPYGGSSYGIEEGAKTYFNKHAKDLTISEAALLAGLPQAPSVYSPYVNPSYAMNRRNDVLQKMYEQKYITKEQKDDALAKKLAIQPPSTSIKAPHFVFYIKSQLEDLYGSAQVEEGGLRVKTTLDLDIQKKAEEILKEELAKVKSLNVSNGAVLITKPSTGEILAMVGSSDYFATPYGAYNILTGKRQPGSSIKPIMYSLALEKGYTAATPIDDSSTAFRISDSEVYRPVNYDGKSHGVPSLRLALANSFNITAVRVLNNIGVDNFVEHAKTMGITTWDDPSRYGLSITLGGVETKPLDMATAFGVFANQGNKVPVSGILNLSDKNGNSIYDLSPDKTKVLNPGVAYIISDILSDNTARTIEFGAHSALEIPGYRASVKTGTTDDKRDNYTIGYTPDYLVFVWVGNNDNSPMNPYLASGITGAAPIWNRVMEYMITQQTKDPSKWFQQPSDVVQKTCGSRSEFFLAGTENTTGCSGPVYNTNTKSVKNN